MDGVVAMANGKSEPELLPLRNVGSVMKE